MGFALRTCFFICGILLKTTAALALMFELNLLPIHGRNTDYYVQVLALKFPMYLFIMGFVLIVCSFYFPRRTKRRGKV